MTPQDIIAELDAALAEVGQDVVLRRYLGPGVTNPVDVTCRARITDYTTQTLAGNIAQGDRRAIISPTEATAASWPLPVRVGDKLVINGREFNIEGRNSFAPQNVVVRIELQVRG